MKPRKVYAQIDELDQRLAAILLQEFGKLADGGTSRFLSWYRHDLYTGTFWRDADSQETTRLVHRIKSLGKKVGDPAASATVTILDQWASKHDTPTPISDKVAEARKAVATLATRTPENA